MLLRAALDARRAARVAVAATLMSAAAAAIHAAVAAPHFREYAPFGLLFGATALAQATWAMLDARAGRRPRRGGVDAGARSRRRRDRAPGSPAATRATRQP